MGYHSAVTNLQVPLETVLRWPFARLAVLVLAERFCDDRIVFITITHVMTGRYTLKRIEPHA